MTKTKKLAVFDMDGTLIKEVVTDSNGEILPSRWTQIMHHLGDEACRREQEAKRKWYDDVYKNHPVDFLNDIIKTFYDGGLKYDYFEKVIGNYAFFPEVEHVIEELHNRGYKTALISGGFKALADEVSEELGIDYTCAACELKWNHQGNLVGWDLFREDYGSKVASLEEIIAECGANVSECVYVGNGNNDVSAAKYVVDNGGIAIAFNGTSELRKVCTHSIMQPGGKENFYDVLEYIDLCESQLKC